MDIRDEVAGAHKVKLLSLTTILLSVCTLIVLLFIVYSSGVVRDWLILSEVPLFVGAYTVSQLSRFAKFEVVLQTAKAGATKSRFVSWVNARFKITWIVGILGVGVAIALSLLTAGLIRVACIAGASLFLGSMCLLIYSARPIRKKIQVARASTG